MANPPQLDPDDPDDLDDLDFLPEEEEQEQVVPRGKGIPEVVERRRKKEDLMDDLTRSKESLPAFSPQDRRQAKRLEQMDLESEEEGLGQKITPRTPKKTSPKLSGDSKADQKASGRELEESLRRAAGIAPGSVRSSDFEPLAWESSKSKVEDPMLDEEGQPVPRVTFGACVGSVIDALKGAGQRLNVIEKAGVSAFLLVALIGLFVFRSLVHSVPQPEEVPRELLSTLSLPAKGQLLTVASLDAVWRKPQSGDIVRPGMLVVPEVKIQASGTGFLRILFRNNEDKIQGDPFFVQLTGGSEDHAVICSQGYDNTMNLVECQAGRQKPWTVSVYESREFDLPIEEWNLLVRFEMPSEMPRTP